MGIENSVTGSGGVVDMHILQDTHKMDLEDVSRTKMEHGVTEDTDNNYIPILAARCILRTFTHSTMAAPELSIQFSIDCLCQLR